LNKVGVKQRGLCGKNNDREHRADVPDNGRSSRSNGPLISLTPDIQQERESERERDMESEKENESEKQLQL